MRVGKNIKLQGTLYTPVSFRNKTKIIGGQLIYLMFFVCIWLWIERYLYVLHEGNPEWALLPDMPGKMLLSEMISEE